jgi:V8-like Glu-specific endopeptidase
MKLVLGLFLLFFSVFSFAKNDIDKVIGDDDFIAVNSEASNIPLRYKNIVDAFGLMASGCTATHIGNGYVLTAGHCFWAPETLVENTACDDETVDWGFRDENKKPYLTSKCETVIAKMHGAGMDFAIFKVSPIPPVAVSVDLQRHAVIGDTLTIFSHPDGFPLQWSQSCGVEYVLFPELAPEALEHKCDTNPGSSGATIINVLSLKIVGIHDGGFVDQSSGAGMNYGTFIMASPLQDILRGLGFN